LRDASGNIISNGNVLVEVSILSSQSIVYSEIHNTSTSSNGIISLKIGSKNQSSFSNIDWSNKNHSIRVKVSLEGSDYYITTESDLLSVPYALYAKESSDSPQLISSIAKVQADVDQNETDADAAIAALQTDVDGNESDADAAIAALQTDVDGNESDADAAIAALQTDVDGNESDADAAIAALQTDIDQNETDSDAADAVLQSNIDGLSNSAVSSLNDLSDVVIETKTTNGSNRSFYIGNPPNNTTDDATGNTSLGDDALSRITSGYANSGFGAYANYQTSEGSGNTALGYGTLFANKTGDYNVGIGINSASSITTGSFNIALGGGALDVITTGSYNTAIGNAAEASSATSENETMLGYNATGQGTNTVTLGNSSVSAVYMAEDSGATVYAAGLNLGGTAITVNAAELNYLDGVTSNIQTQLDNAGGASNVTALSDALVEDNSMYIGNAPSSTDTAKNNIGLGIVALQNITTGDNNTALGTGTLRRATIAEGNVAIGINAMQNNISGSKNIAISPYRALNALTTGQQNIAIGMDAVRDITGASYNIGIGTYALGANKSGNYNLAIGYRAMANTGTGGFNSAYGYDALRIVSSGTGNIGIGKDAGDQITTGSDNVIIGNNAQAIAANASNQIVIGKGATGQADDSVTLGNADVTAIYMGQDSGATVYAGGITFSDGTSQTTAVVASESKVSYNQVRTTGFTDTDNVLEIGDLVIRLNNNYLEWKTKSAANSDYFDATITILGSRAANNWGSLNRNPSYGDANSIRATNTFQEIVDRTEDQGNYSGGPSADYENSPGLWYYKMVEFELFNSSQNESYKITAYGYGSGKVTIKGEYWNFK
jgi:hypothetical protein